MQELIHNITELLSNIENKEAQLDHMLNWVNTELENPTPVKGYTLEEKVKWLKEQKVVLEAKIEEFKEHTKTEVNTLKDKINKEYPHLFTYAQAKHVVDKMIARTL